MHFLILAFLFTRLVVDGMRPALPIKRLRPCVPLPRPAHHGDTALDLHYVPPDCGSPLPIVLRPGARALVPTGIAVDLASLSKALPPPLAVYGRIADRSGNAWKRGLHVLGGVVDPSYRGEVKVILANLGSKEVMIDPYERVAQLVLEVIVDPSKIIIEEREELTRSERGVNGFGSTGRK
jgi:dUTP pyrophosphatase